MFKMSTSDHNSCSQLKLPPINRLINNRLFLSQTMRQFINIPRTMLTDPLIQHCQYSIKAHTKMINNYIL